MRMRIVRSMCLGALCALAAIGQNPEGYLDVFVVKVKPEKRAEFDAIDKKIVEANRRNKGDYWLTSETMYGEGNTVYFTSQRTSYADVEKSMDAFMGALAKPGGAAGAAKVLQDFNNTVISSRAELRRRRFDLSSTAGADAASVAKLVAQSRFIRTNIVRIRPGRLGDYQEQLRTNKAAMERAHSQQVTLVSQSVAGTPGTVFYISQLGKSLADFDNTGPTLPQALGEAGFQKYVRTLAESVFSNETIINRYLPELSNPPEQIASANPDFWKPKAAAKPKAPPKTE
jgi:hypothetical protein